MQFRDFIVTEANINDLEAATKNDALAEMVDSLISAGALRQETRKGILAALCNREKLGSTGIGNGVAIPHAKHPAIKNIIGLFARSREGVAFDSLDGEPAHLFFLILSSQDAAAKHLETLAYISKHLRDDNFCRFLRNARDGAEIQELLVEADEKALVNE